MRRERRNEKDNSKGVLYFFGIILCISVITFIITFVTYSKNTQILSTEKISEIVDANISKTEIVEPASSQISKTIEEVKEEALEAENQINTITIFDNTQELNNDISNMSNNTNYNQTENTVQTNTEMADEKKLEFIMPVEGEILREYAKDNLTYSNTLKEWITHLGVDIEAEKATVVKAAEDGEVIAIKTDPRYGITVIIKHKDGFETRYANLLTAEYVTEGEKVSKGQTIGTVGNTASFEIADKTHLHFEMIKDDEYVDPRIYIK